MAGTAMNTAAGRTYNNNYSNVTTEIKAPITVNVDASGLTTDQAQTMVQRSVQDALTETINGCRGSIPSPAARRN